MILNNIADVDPGRTIFPLIQRTRRQPMFDLSLLRKPTFVAASPPHSG
jgi:hypothetical protein